MEGGFFISGPPGRAPKEGGNLHKFDNLHTHCTSRGFSLETTPPHPPPRCASGIKGPDAVTRREGTGVCLVIPEQVAVVHLQSLWGPKTEDTHGDATPQSYQCPQIGHFFTEKGNALRDGHGFLGHRVEHTECGLPFLLREERRRALRTQSRLGVGTRHKCLGVLLWAPPAPAARVLRLHARASEAPWPLVWVSRGCLKTSVSPAGVGFSNSLQSSCLENPMDSGAWWATVHGVKRNDLAWPWDSEGDLAGLWVPSYFLPVDPDAREEWWSHIPTRCFWRCSFSNTSSIMMYFNMEILWILNLSQLKKLFLGGCLWGVGLSSW